MLSLRNSIERRYLAMLVLVVAASFAGVDDANADDQKATVRVYVGSYSNAKGEGIYVGELNVATGKLSELRLAAEAANPSFLAIHPNRKFLYAVAEVDTVGGKKTGGVIGYAIRQDGTLEKLNEETSQGGGPCHLVVDATGKNVLVANYGGGSVACLPIDEKGMLKPATSAIQHTGKSVNANRQSAPHAHSINVDAGNRFVFAADLGLDQVLVYRFDAAKGLLTPNDPPHAAVAPGAGPRHFAFHPSGKFAYVINEIGNTVTGFRYNADKGTLTEIQSIGTLPASFRGTSHTAEVVVHPSGKFLYGSNRGHDSLAIYSIDAESGKLTVVGHESTQGKTPRNFNVDPTGAVLLAENQNSGTIVVFQVDTATGKLKSTGQSVAVKQPVCVKFLTLAP